MNKNIDRLYELLPEIYRRQDAEQGLPLKALLRVIAEQVSLLEEDIAQLYENWFIETCQDWVVPYIGDLVGYQAIYMAVKATSQQRDRLLISRRDVATTIRQKRRKGTLAMLEELANMVAGWPVHAVEFFPLIVQTPNIKYLNLASTSTTTVRSSHSQTVNLRDGDVLDRMYGAFDPVAHTVDMRRVTSHRTSGLFNFPDIGLYIWQLQPYSVTRTLANRVQKPEQPFFTFSILGNDTPLYTKPAIEPSSTTPEELRFPTPIRRRAFSKHITDYYGEGKSLQIWTASAASATTQEEAPSPIPVAPERIVIANLSRWQHYQLGPEQVAVDPVYGRIAFPKDALPTHVWVSYQYVFSADIGGGEYDRPLSEPVSARLYRVGPQEESKSIAQAIALWEKESPKPPDAVIEITESGVYTEPLNITLAEHESLHIRAANKTRPVLRQEGWRADSAQNILITGAAGSSLILDGLLIAGMGVGIQGDLATVTLRHCTLVPGWGIKENHQPRWRHRVSRLPSLEFLNTSAHITIEHSIIGLIQIIQNPPATTGIQGANQNTFSDPLHMDISDSIIDATRSDLPVLSAPNAMVAPVLLTVARCTILGALRVHAIELAENSIFTGPITVARRQIGCMRFCSLTLPARTPGRYNCQPDLVIQAVADNYSVSAEKRATAIESEQRRTQPLFNSTQYGRPGYCQLASTCAQEITGGADDEAEMGAFHDLYQPQRTANLRLRLDEYTRAGMETGIIYEERNYMNGDFSRVTFDQSNQYSRVLMQQGRALLDADWNEQAAILNYALRAFISDAIGPRWGVIDGPMTATNVGSGNDQTTLISLTNAPSPVQNSFLVRLRIDQNAQVPYDFQVSPGHYYIDGMLCENSQILNYTEQQGFPIPLQDNTTHLVYLDAWERSITYLEDSTIREIALGTQGPDTAIRAKVVWQVRVPPTTSLPSQLQNELHDIARKTGAARVAIIEDITQKLIDFLQPDTRGPLKARATASTQTQNPYSLLSDARYQGTENQLYRLEIHQGGPAGRASFKWSRENGSVVFPVTAINGNAVTLGNLGRDDALTIEQGDWVELVNDEYIAQIAGNMTQNVRPLLQVVTVDRVNAVVTLSGTPNVNLGTNPLLRRWDQRTSNDAQGNVIPLSSDGTIIIQDSSQQAGNDTQANVTSVVTDSTPTTQGGNQSSTIWLTLEDGVQMQFQPSPSTTVANTYRTGDYWLIPARTLLGDIIWPQDQAKGGPQALPPQGEAHHYAPLAIVVVGNTGNILSIYDLRYMLPPLAKTLALLSQFEFPQNG